MISTLRLALATVLIVVISAFALGQSAVTGAIVGSVVDPSSAVIPGATVTLRSVGTNKEDTATTGAEGRYRFVNLQPGIYSISIKMGEARNHKL